MLSSVGTLPPSFDAFQNAFDVDAEVLQVVDSEGASAVVVVVEDASDAAAALELVVLVVEYTVMGALVL